MHVNLLEMNQHELEREWLVHWIKKGLSGYAAAEKMGITARTFYNMLDRHGLRTMYNDTKVDRRFTGQVQLLGSNQPASVVEDPAAIVKGQGNAGMSP